MRSRKKPRTTIPDDFLESLTLKSKKKGDGMGLVCLRDISLLALLGRREQREMQPGSSFEEPLGPGEDIPPIPIKACKTLH